METDGRRRDSFDAPPAFALLRVTATTQHFKKPQHKQLSFTSGQLAALALQSPAASRSAEAATAVAAGDCECERPALFGAGGLEALVGTGGVQEGEAGGAGGAGGEGLMDADEGAGEVLELGFGEGEGGG